MNTRGTHDLPPRLEGVRRRFERWRQTRKVRSPIPEPLWTSAMKMADMYGLHQTAKILRVNYYSLKKLVKREATVTAGVPEKDPASMFVELAPPVGASSCECTLELEAPGGAKMAAVQMVATSRWIRCVRRYPPLRRQYRRTGYPGISP